MNAQTSTTPVGRHSSDVANEEPLQLLRSTRAKLELLLNEREREALVAAAAGHSQREIARAMGESQATINRLLSRARARQQAESPLTVSARQILLRYLAGELKSRGDLLGQLTGVRPGEFAPGNQVDGYIAGSWDEVRTAYLDGMIDTGLYEYLRSRLRPHYAPAEVEHDVNA